MFYVDLRTKSDYILISVNRCLSINDTDTAGFTSTQNRRQNLVLCILILIFFESKLLEDKRILCHPRFLYSVQKIQPLLPILKIGTEPMPSDCFNFHFGITLQSTSSILYAFISSPIHTSQTLRPSNPDTMYEPQ